MVLSRTEELVTRDYELHVTFDADPGDTFESIGWKYSKITDDPVLGRGNKYYLTKHTDTILLAIREIAKAQNKWPEAIRYKIELTVFDVKKVKVENPNDLP